MNTSKKLLMALAIMSIAFGACKKKKKEEETTPSSTLTCKLNGVEYSASSFDNTIVVDGSSKRVDIRGKKGSKQMILTMGDPSGESGVKVTTYYTDVEKNDPMTKIALGTFINGSMDYYYGNFDENGSIVVTESSSGKVKGTFQFLMINANEDTIIVTDGKFDATY